MNTGSLPEGDAFRHWIQLNRMATFGEIAAALIHELGQSVTGVCGASDVLEYCLKDSKLKADPTLVNALDLLVQAGKRTADQISRIWDFVKTEAPRPELINLGSVLAESLALMTPVARISGVRIHSSIPPGIIRVWADESLTQLAIVRLLRYAVAAITSDAGSDRQIQIQILSRTDGQGILTVEFDQLAPSESTAATRFQKQPDGGLRPEHESFALCRMIAESVGGTFQVTQHAARNKSIATLALRTTVP